MNRILIIRGGAIGDFILTLPAIRLLRSRFPRAHLEILGYPHITALAHRRFYADAIRSIELQSFAGFFATDSTLPEELIRYFNEFDLIVSYLFDPETIFEINLRRCGIKQFIAGPSKLTSDAHGAFQLARPLEQLDLPLADAAPALFPTDDDRVFAADFLAGDTNIATVIHPGSGSETKNWPIANWKTLGDRLISNGRKLLIASGEADQDRVRTLESAWQGKPVRFAHNLPLPQLAALFENKIFIGHDSGISHIAAAVGARCFLLFGPTDPSVWAPANKSVTVIQAPEKNLRLLKVETVIEHLRPVGT